MNKITLALLFSLTGTANTHYQLLDKTISHSKTISSDTQKLLIQLLRSGAKGADLLLYPAATYLLGNAVYNTFAPTIHNDTIATLEYDYPLARDAKNTTLSLVTGAITLVLLRRLLRSKCVNGFVSNNMPNIGNLLNVIDDTALDPITEA